MEKFEYITAEEEFALTATSFLSKVSKEEEDSVTWEMRVKDKSGTQTIKLPKQGANILHKLDKSHIGKQVAFTAYLPSTQQAWTAMEPEQSAICRIVAKNETVLVRAVTGPKEAQVGDTVEYSVSKYNMDTIKISDKVRQSVKWAVKIDNQTTLLAVDGKLKCGQKITFDVPAEWSGRKVIVMPHLKGYTDKVSACTSVKEVKSKIKEIKCLERWKKAEKICYGEKDVIFEVTVDDAEGYHVSLKLSNASWSEEITISGAPSLIKSSKCEIPFMAKAEWLKVDTDEATELKIEATLINPDTYMLVDENLKTTVGDPKYLSIQVKKRKILLYLLFYVNKYSGADTVFSEAAQTRLQNIKNLKGYDSDFHKVHCPPIQDISEIISIVKGYIDRYGGKNKAFCKEVGVFSHAGALDGPIGSAATSKYSIPLEGAEMQMSSEGWMQIQFNWFVESPVFVLYGCNTDIFASGLYKMDNFKQVEVWGQTESAYPSFYPDKRVTSLDRILNFSWDFSPTYLVGSEELNGLKAVSRVFAPDAKPMGCYKNGNMIESSHQGCFNDDRIDKNDKVLGL